MTLLPRDIIQSIAALQQAGEPFALATVVRTVSVTAAKAGAKAVIRADGTITESWIGGGCARAAVIKAAQQSLVDGQSRLIQVSPADVLAAQGLAPGDTKDGLHYANNACPSQGTMDIFIEPMIPRPTAIIHGDSPVALALMTLAPQFGFTATQPDQATSHAAYLIVATQGRGDEAALKSILTTPATYRAFVGSRAKTAVLTAKLRPDVPPEAIATLHAPAGLDLGAITPEEIALSILAQMVSHRRQGQRDLGQRKPGVTLAS